MMHNQGCDVIAHSVTVPKLIMARDSDPKLRKCNNCVEQEIFRSLTILVRGSVRIFN